MADTPLTGKQQKNRDKYQKKVDMKARAAAEAAERKQGNRLMEETEGLSRTIRAIKSREKTLRMTGIGGAKTGKMAAGMVTGVKKKQGKKKVRGDSGGRRGKGDGASLSMGILGGMWWRGGQEVGAPWCQLLPANRKL